ncbi:hypothetical protein [Kaistella jeonii]|uniref:Uncharacterized protein n=1 Tax=Kaistella jeonii TaxID=266749 RepID=A0A0C1CUW8_9FLAO|nr:hypothetical protein [Kaistella jeonii]KIA88076.1 hypothetical protein OA86_12820 [Kaistella jeonii]SFC31761.1 hypothetical protein SAMN05421876_11360 [Kaistella jeonii]VEI95620.1 Uncharacterised protein [Kaistella jeonii]
MFKYIFIFLVFFVKTQAQVNQSLIGDWTKVKVKINIRTDPAYAKATLLLSIKEMEISSIQLLMKDTESIN